MRKHPVAQRLQGVFPILQGRPFHFPALHGMNSHQGLPRDARRVTARLCSGLGNQLFQFTCGLAHARRHGARFFCDTSWYPLVAAFHSPVRHLRLRELGLPVEEAFHGWRRWLVGISAAAFDRTGRGRAIVEGAGCMTVLQELRALRRHPLADETASPHIYLNGYWQTSDHFLAVREELRKMIRPRAPLSSGAQEWISRITRRKTGFIHVRRGDYATLVGEAGLLPLEYYKEAVCAVDQGGWHWLVFSEDEDWARRNMGFLSSWEMVSYDSSNRDIEDLQLMATCEAAIIANSSYSWWGAALGDSPDRPVVAPDRYWKREGAETCDWILPGWQTVRTWQRGG